MLKFKKVREVKTPTRGGMDSGFDLYVPTLTADFVRKFVELNPTYMASLWTYYLNNEYLDTQTLEEFKEIFINTSIEFNNIELKPCILDTHYNVIIPAGLTYQLDKPSREGVTKEFHITNKSGVASKHSIIVGACVCDYEYRNEVNINIIGFTTFELKPNFKLAQAIIREVEIPEFECYEVDEDVNIFVDETDRGGGFGVTGNGL